MDIQPSNPFKEGTKKFLVAQRIIAGEVDRGRLAREVGVSSQTIYNVVTDLRTHGYTIMLDVNSPKSTATATTPRATSTPPTTQQSTQGEIEGSSPGETTPPTNSPGESQSSSKYYPGETTQEDSSTQVRSQRSTRPATREPGITREDVIEIVGEAMKQVVAAISPEVKQVEEPTGVNLPIEEVQLAGEKVNYRIALNPEIFFRYTVFKARVASLGKKPWDGTFSDWIDMATRDILTVYGMYPTVLTTRGKSFTVEVPQGVQSGEVD